MRLSSMLTFGLAAFLFGNLSGCASSSQARPADVQGSSSTLNRASILLCATSGAVAQHATSDDPSNGALGATVVFMICQLAGSMQEADVTPPPPPEPDRALLEGVDQVKPAAGKAYLAPLTGYRGARVRLMPPDSPDGGEDYVYLIGGQVDIDAKCTYVWGSLDAVYREHISANLTAGHVYQLQPVITFVPRTGFWHRLLGDMATDYHCKMKLYDATAGADVDASVTDESGNG